ncbi:hypothetical protein HY642_03600 [Candidatus Woesearchaeota archaeon]|nr:hypothetical protein [Candidatus Woesearchaeota archaeon]
MNKGSLMVGLGIGFVLLPAIDVLRKLWLIGGLVTIATVVAGVVLIIVGMMRR